jgi:hypothetical protein
MIYYPFPFVDFKKSIVIPLKIEGANMDEGILPMLLQAFDGLSPPSQWLGNTSDTIANALVQRDALATIDKGWLIRHLDAGHYNPIIKPAARAKLIQGAARYCCPTVYDQIGIGIGILGILGIEYLVANVLD